MNLRRALTADLPLKLTSLGLSLFLWFLAAGEEPASTFVPVDVTVTPPLGRTVRADRDPGARARLRAAPRAAQAVRVPHAPHAGDPRYHAGGRGAPRRRSRRPRAPPRRGYSRPGRGAAHSQRAARLDLPASRAGARRGPAAARVRSRAERDRRRAREPCACSGHGRSSRASIRLARSRWRWPRQTDRWKRPWRWIHRASAACERCRGR